MMRVRLALIAATSLVAAAPAWAMPGEEFAVSPAGHVAVLTPTRDAAVLRVAGPDGRFGAPEPAPRWAQVAIGSRGDVAIVHSDGGPEPRLWVSYRPPGAAFEPPVLLDVDTTIAENWAALGVDGAGTVIVGWTSGAPGDEMMVRLRDPVDGWFPAQSLGGRDTFRPRLAVTDDGFATLAWRQQRSLVNTSEVAVATRPSGGRAFGPPEVVGRNPDDPDEPVVATNERGDGVVAWIESRERRDAERSEFWIAGAFRSGRGSFGRPRRLSPGNGAGPAVAVRPDGRMVIAWTDYQNFSRARIRSTGGALRRAVTLTRNPDVNHAVTALPSGRGAVAWSHREPGFSMMRVAQATPDGRFGRPRTVDLVRGFAAFLNPPAFAALPSGLFYLRGRSTTPSPPPRLERVALR